MISELSQTSRRDQGYRSLVAECRVDLGTRLAERVNDLVANFSHYLDEFKRRDVFRGPSIHFHVRAIERRQTHDTVRSAIADDELLEVIYAMLASWGMHRMGPKGAKLEDFEHFCSGISTTGGTTGGARAVDLHGS